MLERGVHAIVDKTLIDDQLLGVSVTRYFARDFGFYSRLMVSPNTSHFIDMRSVFATGLRFRRRTFGVETFLGAGAHAEVRLRTHYWLVYGTPAEIGFTLWERRSFRIELYTGLRAVIAGDLVNHFLLDPNGVNNADAEAALAYEKKRPWEGFISLVLGRAM